ncbi:MAG: MATE family efflux transporter [Kofleriaceae bacterium]
MSWAATPARAMLKLAWPITVSTLSYATMTLVSTAFVARVGADALAGVGLAAVLGFALLCFGIGLARGVKTLVAQSRGAGRLDRIDDYLAAALGVALAIGLVATAIAWIIAPALDRICATAAAADAASSYLRVRMTGAAIVLCMAAMREVRYGEGDTVGPMRATLAANVVNIAGDVVLVLVLHQGVVGAAVATLLGTVTEAALVALPLWPRLRRLALHRDALVAVWREGVGNGVQFLLEVGAFLLLTAVIAGMSSRQAAAHQLVLQVVNVSFLPAHALAEASTILVGQAVGASRYELVSSVARRALALSLGYALACSAVVAIAGDAVAGALSGDDRELAIVAAGLLHVSLLFLWSDAINVVGRGVLRGASDVRWVARVAVLTSWLTTPPLAWLFGVRLGGGAAGGWLAIALEISLGAALFWHRILRQRWRASAEAARREVHAIARAPAVGAVSAVAEDVAADAERAEDEPVPA